ncbi:MAG: molybdopterin oxidoreductase family protein, partial [Acidimicrobiales bacterium]
AALPGARFLPALRRGNVRGALELGMAPGLLPGRLTLDAGRDWFAAGWGSVPDRRGLGTTGILRSLADAAGVRALVTIGADVVGDFPDRQLAARALDAADFVVAVTGHPSATAERADVVLPVAVEHERVGTTTNAEGRVSRLGQKLVPPGLAWADWSIAAELAVELGGDLGFSGPREIWDEIERLAPAFAGCTTRVLESPAGHDGVLLPYDPSAPALGLRPTDPMATPGVESVERQGAPPRVGRSPFSAGPVASPNGSTGPVAALPQGGGDGPARPAAGAGLAAATDGAPAPHVGPADSYSLRLVSRRRLYDGGSAVAHSPSLLSLVPAAEARANPRDLDRLGAATGDLVRLRSSRGEVEVAARADTGVPTGVVVVDFNLPAADGTFAAGILIDAGGPVVEVRMESVR